MSREHEPWESKAPTPFVTIKARGLFDGVVTITAIPGGGRMLVEAFWTRQGSEHSDSVEAERYEDALRIAHAAASELAEGYAPNLTRGYADGG